MNLPLSRFALAALPTSLLLLAGCGSDSSPSSVSAPTLDPATSQPTTGGDLGVPPTEPTATSPVDPVVPTEVGAASTPPATTPAATDATDMPAPTMPTDMPDPTMDDGMPTDPPAATTPVIAGDGVFLAPDGTLAVGAFPSPDFATLDPNNPPQVVQLSGNLGTHDPVIVRSPEGYHQFNTGTGVDRKFSSDLVNWQQNGRVFPNGIPGWVDVEVPNHAAQEGNRLWAPDVSFFGGQYHLYYSVSTFGSQDSCLGHAVTDDLDNGTWTDTGAPLFCSNPGDRYNAIDPNVVMDENGTPWMIFGSFWNGIFAFELDLDGNRVAGGDITNIAQVIPAPKAVEAPFIVTRGGFFYLFTSYDLCCRGTNSTYNVRVSRATNVLGPYVDRDGVDALQGGGTLLLSGVNGLEGPGHNGIVLTDDKAYIVFHAYPNNGAVLRLSELAFDADGWPVTAGP